MSAKEKSRRLISLKIQAPDGTIIESNRKHSPAFHVDNNGTTYMVDYDPLWPRVASDGNHIDMWVYDDSPFSQIRESFTWGTYGINGDRPLEWTKLKDMTDNHIRAIIDGGHAWLNEYLFEMEVEYRNDLKTIYKNMP